MSPRIASGGSPTRRYRRVTARVRVRFSDAHGEREEIATTLGAGGLFVSTEDPLARGTPLKVRFRLFEAGRDHEIEARVVWAKRPTDPGEYAPGMGLEFRDPDAVSRLAAELVEYLRRQDLAARAPKPTRA
jgi:uncharacterized protein (TIGR02266 family)